MLFNKKSILFWLQKEFVFIHKVKSSQAISDKKENNKTAKKILKTNPQKPEKNNGNRSP